MEFDLRLVASGSNMPTGNIVDLTGPAVIETAMHLRGLGVLGFSNKGRDDLLEIGFKVLSDEGLAGVDVCGHRSLTFPLITGKDTDSSFYCDNSLIDHIVEIIKKATPDIIRYVSAIPGLRKLTFESMSLLILSNVLLDEFQIENIEKLYLGKLRPPRKGGNYYAALMERIDGNEAFGIYGNQASMKSGVGMHFYGKRGSKAGPTLANIKQDQLVIWGFAQNDNPVAIGRILAAHLVRIAADASATYPECVGTALVALGLLDIEGHLAIPILVNTDLTALGLLADRFANTLIPALKCYERTAHRIFQNSPYAGGLVTFEEWYIWWYHFLYSIVTDRLINIGLIDMPSSGISTYMTYHRTQNWLRSKST